MKDRYKILILTLVILSIITIISFLIGFSFKLVDFDSFAIPYHNLYGYIQTSAPLTFGRYFLGLQYKLLQFPRGYIHYEFNLTCNTQDKTPINIEALFVGSLLQNQLVNMYGSYGLQYQNMLRLSIEEYIRQAVETYSVVYIISNRALFENYVESEVKTRLEAEYSFIYCNLVSLGEVGTNLINTALYTEDSSLYQQYVNVLQRGIQAYKMQIFYMAGGKDLLYALQTHHANLFNMIAQNMSVVNTTMKLVNSTQLLYLANYLISDPYMKGLQSMIIQL